MSDQLTLLAASSQSSLVRITEPPELQLPEVRLVATIVLTVVQLLDPAGESLPQSITT